MSNIKVNISTELMKNYKQAELMSPEKKFEALQTSTGSSLLFSIGTDNIFYVTQESPGHDTGWVKTDLSSAQLAKSFAGQTGLTCKTFEAAQSVVDGTIGIAMVINDGTSDHLFLSLGNSNSDMSWTGQPAWTQYPFDNPIKNITIANVFLSETINNTQYIVVDILRDPASDEKLITRYYINTSGSPAWQTHDIPIDLEADSYSSCLGRQYLAGSPHQPTIDGLYTFGQVDGNAQFIFQPLYNVFNPVIPAPSAKLFLPNNLIADAMASCRKHDMSTDLFVCSNGGLYYFASSNQNNGATAVLLMQNSLFNGVSKMYAYQANGIVTVWGLNKNNQVFYTSCPIGQEQASPSVWTYPLPIGGGVDLFSPYLNCIDNGNTFFAVADNILQKAVKSAQNSTWQTQSIVLPSLSTADTQKYSSYTTLVQVTDENNQPLLNSPVTITAETRTGVYINHLYYVLDTMGTQVNTDQFGNITVIEWVTGLVGTKLTVTGNDGIVKALNPMDIPMSKIAAMNNVSALKNATITNTDGSTRPLVSSSVSATDLQTVATANGQLGTVYAKLNARAAAMAGKRVAVMARPPQALKIDGIEAILVDAGDLFSWLESGIEAAIQIIEDVENDVWHFVATIAGQAFSCILDVVEKVVGAVIWVYNIIKTAIEDLILFLEFLFGWHDILRTHKVMKNVFIQLSMQSINGLSSVKTDIASVFTAMQKDVNKWAEIPSFGQNSGNATGATAPLAGQNTAPSNLGVHHFQGNASSANSGYAPPSFTEAIFQDLMDLLNNEASTLSGAFNAIQTDIIDQFSSLSVTQIIEKFIAIVVDTLLQTAENILLAVVDVFVQLAEGAVSAMTASLDIPVLSWLYKEISGEDLSFLDLICLIAAIPTTIIYKIGSNAAPFPEGDSFTDGLIGATSFAEIQDLFYTSPASAVLLPSGMNQKSPAKRFTHPETETVLEEAETPVLDESRLKTFGIVTGCFALVGAIVLIVTTAAQRALDTASASVAPAPAPVTHVGFPVAAAEVGGAIASLKAIGSSKTALATIAAFGNIAYVSPNIATFINARTDNWYQQMNNVVTGISIVKGFVNIIIAKVSTTSFPSTCSAGAESIINLIWNVPVIMNVIDNKQRWDTDYQSLIPETIGNFAFNLGGMLEWPIAMTTDPKIKAGEMGLQYVLMGVYGVCMPIAGGIYEWVPGQNHGEPQV